MSERHTTTVRLDQSCRAATGGQRSVSPVLVALEGAPGGQRRYPPPAKGLSGPVSRDRPSHRNTPSGETTEAHAFSNALRCALAAMFPRFASAAGNRGDIGARAACAVLPAPFRPESLSAARCRPTAGIPMRRSASEGDGAGPSVARADGRRREEPCERGTRVRRPHERLPDEKGVHSVASHQIDVRHAVDAALGHQERAGRNAIEE